MSGNGEQLVSFFLYSLFIYPVTNYIVSPQRKYPRWRAAVYAIIFLLSVSTLHMWYDNIEAGPNHYQLLNVDRNTPVSIIKKSYRSLSLEYHPDKNKDPAAVDTFTKIKHAFDVITDKEKRREYNRLGDHGVAVLAQSVVDYQYIMLQLIVYYVSSAIFAFLMTFSEPTGDAFQICIFGLSVMLLMEMLLVVQEVSLPNWFLPNITSNDIVVVLHRLYPAFMNGCRCITGAFHIDSKAVRVVALESVANCSRDLSMRVSSISRALLARSEPNDTFIEEQEEQEGQEDQDYGDDVYDEDDGDADLNEQEDEGEAGIKQDEGINKDEDNNIDTFSSERGIFADREENGLDKMKMTDARSGLRSTLSSNKYNNRNRHRNCHHSTAPTVMGAMEKGLSDVRRRVANSLEGRSGQIGAFISEKVRQISDAKALREQHSKNSASRYSPGLILLRDVCIYLVARFFLVKGK